jgi:mono/diheme cytochrome c family protein
MRTLAFAALLTLPAAPAFSEINFKRQVQPILETRCVRCHGPYLASKHLRLSTRERAMEVIVPFRPDKSTLYLIAKGGMMPPGDKKLTEAELETLRKWIAEGAKWTAKDELVPK